MAAADEAGDDQDRHVGDEEVGGDGEDLARLADAPQVAEGQQHDEAHGQRARRGADRAGTAETMASAPAATDTATVMV